MTASAIWKALGDERRLRAADAFWRENEGAEQQAEATVLLAQRLRSRPRFVQGLAPDRKARHLARLAGLPDALIARLLISYHLATQREMMGTFLDALGIPHQSGLIAETVDAAPDPARLQHAAADLGSRYDARDVAIYLSTLLLQDPETWSGLAEVPEARLTAAPA